MDFRTRRIELKHTAGAPRGTQAGVGDVLLELRASLGDLVNPVVQYTASKRRA